MAAISANRQNKAALAILQQYHISQRTPFTELPNYCSNTSDITQTINTVAIMSGCDVSSSALCYCNSLDSAITQPFSFYSISLGKFQLYTPQKMETKFFPCTCERKKLCQLVQVNELSAYGKYFRMSSC